MSEAGVWEWSSLETLDDSNLDHVKEVVLHAAQSADPPWVVVDLSHITFFSSSFIEVLFRAWNRLNARDGGKFSICGLSPYCAEVLQITHLDQVWQIDDSREDAVRAMLDA